MNWKHVVAVCVIAVFPSFAIAAKPTKADVVKVVQAISADEAKLKTYCDMAKIEEQMSKLDEKKDAKKLEDLGKELDAMSQKLGPEYVKLMEGMQEVDPESAEGPDRAR